MTTPVCIGIDLGGTTLRAAAFPRDGEAATALELHKERVGDARDPATLVERIAVLVERQARRAIGQTPVPVGVGIAAMLRDRRGDVANAPHLAWRDVPFGAMLAARLGPRFELGVYNDVNAITWGEAVAGAARKCNEVLAVYVGTGIGGGVITNGALVEGASNTAGEIGHTKVRWDADAAPCNCGSRGCVEAYVGGSYVKRRIAAELPTKGKKSRALELAGSADAATAAHVDEAARDGDAWALDLWTELATLLGVALGNAVAVLNPERLVLGGGLLAHAPTLQGMAENIVLLTAPIASTERLAIVSAELGDDAGLVGAAALATGGVSIIR